MSDGDKGDGNGNEGDSNGDGDGNGNNVGNVDGNKAGGQQRG